MQVTAREEGSGIGSTGQEVFPDAKTRRLVILPQVTFTILLLIAGSIILPVAAAQQMLASMNYGHGITSLFSTGEWRMVNVSFVWSLIFLTSCIQVTGIALLILQTGGSGVKRITPWLIGAGLSLGSLFIAKLAQISNVGYAELERSGEALLLDAVFTMPAALKFALLATAVALLASTASAMFRIWKGWNTRPKICLGVTLLLLICDFCYTLWVFPSPLIYPLT